MLGAAAYMPVGFEMAFDMTDLGQLMPSDIMTNDGQTFQALDVWLQLSKWFKTPVGQPVWDSLGFEQQIYITTLWNGTKTTP